MSSNFVEENIVPKLNEILKTGNQFSEYHLWDDYDPSTKNQNEDQKPKHMKTRNRNRKPYTHSIGNTPISYAGVEIGMMIMRVPWMNPLAFEGTGVPLNIIQDVKKVTATNDPNRPRKPVPV